MDKGGKYVLNFALSGSLMLGAGYWGRELSDLIMNSDFASTIPVIKQHADTITKVVSAGCSYVGGAGSFVVLNGRTNRDIFGGENGFNYLEYAKDLGKLFLTTLPIKATYFIGKPYAMHKLQEQGIDPGTSSLIADTATLAVYLGYTKFTSKKFTRFQDEVDQSTSTGLE